MSQVKVTWNASEATRMQELVATGDKPETTRTFTMDLFDLTPEERQAIAEFLGKSESEIFPKQEHVS